jgi:hypothetical protein
MMPIGSRSRRVVALTAKVLVLVLLAISPRALLEPNSIVNKSQESKRPKSPRNVVRAEPVRIPGMEKQGQSPNLSGATPEGYAAGLVRSARIQTLPPRALTQLTKPDYLKSFSAGIPPIPLGPPA